MPHEVGKLLLDAYEQCPFINSLWLSHQDALATGAGSGVKPRMARTIRPNRPLLIFRMAQNRIENAK